jgi:hypothetical protein
MTKDITKQTSSIIDMNNGLIPDSFESYRKAAKTIGLGISILISCMVVIKLGSIMLSDLKKTGL